MSGAPLHPDEASLAPERAPGVLDQPEVLAALAAVAHHGHGVVDVVSAVGLGIVAAGVVLVDAAPVVKHVGGLRANSIVSG